MRFFASLLLAVLVQGIVAASEPPVTVTPGANFYGQETREPGKLRRWMRNDGDLRLADLRANASGQAPGHRGTQGTGDAAVRRPQSARNSP